MPRKSAKPAPAVEAAPQFAVVKVGRTWQLTLNGQPEGEPYKLRRDAIDAMNAAVADYTPPAAKPKPAPKPGITAADVAAVAPITAVLDAIVTANEIAAMTPLDRLAQAKVEAAAKKAAKLAGQPQPPTPILDWMANPSNARRPRSAGGNGAAKVRMADTDVRAWIEAKRAEGVDAGPGKLLALFRSSGLSCSQERFRAIASS